MDCWHILEIEATQDKKAIKRAYAKKLKRTPPDENPTAFQELNEAYQMALNMAKYAVVSQPTEEYFEQPVSDVEQNADIQPGVATDEHQETDDASEKFRVIQEEIKDLEVELNRVELPPSPDVVSHQNLESQELPDEKDVEFSNTINRLYYAIEQQISNPTLRNNKTSWQQILDDEQLTSFQVKNALSFYVFELLADYFNSDSPAQDGVYIPRSVLKELNNTFHWHEDELELAKHFSPQTIDLMFAHMGITELTNIESTSEKVKRYARGILGFAKWTAAFYLLFIIAGGLLDYKQKNRLNKEIHLKSAPWVTTMETCRGVTVPEPGTAFDECLAVAESGVTRAQKFLGYLYLTPSEHRNVQKSYDWLSKAALSDTEANLFANVLLLEKGQSEQDKTLAETRITQIVKSGFAPAKAYAALYYLQHPPAPIGIRSPLDLLTEAYNEDPQLLDPLFYSRMIYQEDNSSVARQVLDSYALSNPPHTLNEVAWYLATAIENPINSPEYALNLALIATSVESGNPTNYHYIDTLAATYAATGQYELAVDKQTYAMELLASSVVDETLPDHRLEDFDKRLQLYKKRGRLALYDFYADPGNDIKKEAKALNQILLTRLGNARNPD